MNLQEAAFSSFHFVGRTTNDLVAKNLNFKIKPLRPRAPATKVNRED
jgi:hypothetical protein